MTDGERMVWAMHWCLCWRSGVPLPDCARMAARAVDALRGAALPDDPAAAAMLRQMRGES